MAQGEGVSVLVRAVSITGETRYITAAEKALASIFFDSSVGGVSTVTGMDYIFPQEYPTDPPSYVLNGAIAAYLGVHDYYRLTKDSHVKMKADTILRTLHKALEHYDAGYWSLYGLCPRYLAAPRYQLLHALQLRVLHAISGNQKFHEFAEKFERQSQSTASAVRYVIANHDRQIRSLRPSTFRKIPGAVWRILRGDV